MTNNIFIKDNNNCALEKISAFLQMHLCVDDFLVRINFGIGTEAIIAKVFFFQINDGILYFSASVSKYETLSVIDSEKKFHDFGKK